MSFSVGIVGLPNVGKSTLFQLVTKHEVNTANYPFATIDPNVGVVPIGDERLERVARVVASKEVLPVAFEFVDIAGLVKGAHQGAGLGNQFLARIREVDAILHLVRTFPSPEVIHFEGRVDPVADFEAVLEELKLKDEESKEKENLLSLKPQLVLLNGGAEKAPPELVLKLRSLQWPYLFWDLEEDSTAEKLTEMLDKFKQLLDLIVFFSANETAARSWLVKAGTPVSAAAGVIHTDFERDFIRAEVVNWEKLVEAGSWPKAREHGWLQIEGRSYPVQDGDVIEIKV